MRGECSSDLTTSTTVTTQPDQGTAPTTINTTSPNYLPQAYPQRYPGVALGCVMDRSDGKFCATKVADLREPTCDFFYSCCYGELLKFVDMTEQQKNTIERACPRSLRYQFSSC
jgi:hypothetical protein